MRGQAHKVGEVSVSRPAWARYGVAVASVVVALALKLLLDPVIGQETTPFRLFLAAVVISAWFGGMGPGLLATFLAVPIANYFFLNPVGSFTGLSLTVGSLGLFAVEGALVSALVAALHTARRRAEAKTLEARAHQEDLMRSEERFRLLVEGVRDYAIFMLEPDGRMASWNAGAERTMGYAAEEAIGKYFSLFFTYEERRQGKPEQELRVAISEGCFEDEDWRVRKDGSRFWANVLVTPLRDEDGGLRGFSKLVRDMTERKQMEDNLRHSEQRFRSLVQHSSDVITVLEADGAIRYQSPSIERVLGYRPEEMVGKNAFGYVHPRDADRVSRTFTDGVEVGTSTATVQFRFRRKDGTWRHLEAIGTNLLEEPAVGGIVVNSRDVTERKRAEDALRRSLDALLALYETAQVLSSSLQREEIGSQLMEIMRRISGIRAAVIHLQNGNGSLQAWRTSGPKELLNSVSGNPEVRAVRRNVLETGKTRSFELRPHKPELGPPLTGVLLPLLVRDRTIGMVEAYGPEELAEKESIETLASLATQAASALDNARLYEELFEREERLKELVGKLINAQEEERRRVAYEVHDGLTQIMVAAYQYLQDFADVYPPSSEQAREELDEAIALVRRSVGEARRVIADLRPTTLDDLGISAALWQQVSELRAEPRQVEYTESLGEERLPSEIEITLFRVAQEALTNVKKHAGKGTPVQVSLERKANSVRLTVEDQGQGFDPKRARSDSGPGERVGLSSMRERVALLGGELVIRSEPGAGTQVVADIPLFTEEG